LETLNAFIQTYRDNLNDWLFVLLTRLLIKHGGENLTTVSRKLCACLDTVLNSFPGDLQFKTLITFIKDNSIQVSNYKVKIAVFQYMQALLFRMNSADIRATDDLKYAVCRIVTLTAEPKSQELRKASTAVLIALFNMNSSEMTTLLNALPQNIYDTASKIIKAHLSSVSGEEGERGGKSPKALSSFSIEYESKATFMNNYVNNLNSSQVADETSGGANSGAQLSHVIKDIQNLNMNTNYHYLPSGGGKHHHHRGMKNDEILSKDSGVQSNGDLDSG
jgi:CLIP-associating protein 1/2